MAKGGLKKKVFCTVNALGPDSSSWSKTNKEHIKKHALIATLVTIYSSAQENQGNVLLIMSAGLTSLQQPHFVQQAKVRLSTCREFHEQESKILKGGKDLTQAFGYGTSQNTNVFISKLWCSVTDQTPV